MRAEAPYPETGRSLVIGLGCERGTPPAELLDLALSALTGLGARLQDVAFVATLDVRAEEPAMHTVARHFSAPLATFPARLFDVLSCILAEYVADALGTTLFSQEKNMFQKTEFPNHVLPQPLQQAMWDVFNQTQTPAAMIFSALMVAVATADMYQTSKLQIRLEVVPERVGQNGRPELSSRHGR